MPPRESIQMRIAFTVWALLAVGAAAWLFYPTRNWSEPEQYTFQLPLMFWDCFHYHPANGEIMAAWDIQQPMMIEIEDGNTLYLNGGSYMGCRSQAIFHVKLNAAVFDANSSFGGSPK